VFKEFLRFIGTSQSSATEEISSQDGGGTELMAEMSLLWEGGAGGQAVEDHAF
jgi:hypothetical protein